MGDEEYANLNRCQEFLEHLSSTLEERYESDFEYLESPFPNGKRYRHDFITSSDDYFAIQCNEDYENPSIVSQIYLDSKVYVEANTEFYNSGL